MGRSKARIFVVDDWPGGFKATMKFKILEKIVNGWEIHLVFSSPIKSLTVWRVMTPSIRTGTRFILKNMPWNKVLKKDMLLEVSFLAYKINTNNVPTICAVLVWNRNLTFPSTVSTTYSPTSEISKETSTSLPPSSLPTKQPTKVISTTQSFTTPVGTNKPLSTYKPSLKYPYDYNEILKKSILFYEAQRSGILPSSNRISWRGNSAIHDQGMSGENLVGGWYDAGDHVKFGFPMAFSTTLLTWGLLEYRDAYLNSGELENMLDSIKWPLDYFIKAHVKPDVFYGQVFLIQKLHIKLSFIKINLCLKHPIKV